MISTSIPLGLSLSASAAIVASFIVKFTAKLMLGDQRIGCCSAEFRDELFVGLRQPGSGQQQRWSLDSLHSFTTLGVASVMKKSIITVVGGHFQSRTKRYAD